MIKLIFSFAKVNQSGFTLIEVITGMLISIMTMSMTANLFITANLYKVVAKKNAAMQSLIQSDLEVIKSQAKAIAQDNSKCDATVATGYANTLKTLLGNANSNSKIVNDTYTMTRTIMTITDPDILPISYRINRSGSSLVEYSIYMEVVPNAIFKCPSSL